MKKLYFIITFLLISSALFSQEGFKILSDKKKITIPFQLGNNLIIIPVELNNVKLNFLLDTGVENTILFSLEDADSINFKSIEKIKIRGLGQGKSIDALQSRSNNLVIKDFVDNNHEVFIILDQDVNFSSQLGIPVHGIIGYEFFKNYFVEFNYRKKRIFVYRDKQVFSSTKLKKYDKIPLSIELEKPYIKATVNLNGNNVQTKLLIDTGGSDAMWLFENEKNINVPDNYFIDFLGRGFSGDINGKRSRIEKITIGSNEILKPTISFPDNESIQHVNMVQGRNGSIGSEIMRRFSVLFDYKNGAMYLKKNSDFLSPFNYNMSGMEVQHNGLQWIKEEFELKTHLVTNDNAKLAPYQDDTKSVKYQFALKPKYEVMNVRLSSPADKAGIKKGDIIERINGDYAYKYKLQDIISMMQSEEGRWIRIEVERNGTIFKTKFQLKKIL